MQLVGALLVLMSFWGGTHRCATQTPTQSWCPYKVLHNQGQEGRLCFRSPEPDFQCLPGSCKTHRSPRRALLANVLGNGSVLLQWLWPPPALAPPPAPLHGFVLSCTWEGAYTRFQCASVRLGTACRDYLLADPHGSVRYQLCLQPIFGTGPEYDTRSRQGFDPGLGTDTRSKPGFDPVPGTNTGSKPGYEPAINTGFRTGYNSGTDAGSTPGYDPETDTGSRPRYDPRINAGSRLGYDPGTLARSKPGFNPRQGTDTGSRSRYNPGADTRTISGLDPEPRSDSISRPGSDPEPGTDTGSKSGYDSRPGTDPGPERDTQSRSVSNSWPLECVEFTVEPAGMRDIVVAMTAVGGSICVMLVLICLLVAYLTENLPPPSRGKRGG